MKTLEFKTNINCGACVRSVKGFLDEVPGVERWEVDTASPEKTLRVTGHDLTEPAVMAAVREAGFEIEPRHAA